MQIKIHIEYAPRESAYVWGLFHDGQQIHWRKGKTTVDATKNQVLEAYPNCEFTVSE